MLNYCKYFLLFLLVVGIEPGTAKCFHSNAIFKQTPYPHVSSEEGREHLAKILRDKNAFKQFNFIQLESKIFDLIVSLIII